ncbi:GNAT family N-acetyltransferase [Halocatena marina]|uniref:GNAT family N-acetyltransferase n=1 Tax=Halocatena marina TaxID=2934937 RepID=A0ABD5YGY8_9EURY|nr:GNAT family N-acetyltransferase [Halocatena marina]
MTDIRGDDIRRADDETRQIRDQLAAGGMLYEDIDPARSRFWLAERGGTIAGVVRLELNLPGALLGSLYVEPEHRANGLGETLVERIEQEARSQRATNLYLFSTEAGDYFRTHGYQEVAVEEIVSRITNTSQVEYYSDRPDLLTEEITFRKSFVTDR